MKEQLVSILIVLQAKQDFFFVVYMCLGAVILKAYGQQIIALNFLPYAAACISVLLIAVYLTTLVAYLFYPSYVDHIEVAMASIAWLGMHGHAFYPNLATDDVYGLVYGPVLYLLHGLFFLIEPTITTSKLLGVVSLLVAIGLIFIIMKQKVASSLTSFLFVASLVTFFAPFGPFAYWTRPEPFLILITAIALLVVIRLPPSLAGAIIGVLAGLAAGFKLHGFIYVAPIAMMTLAQSKTPRDKFILAAIGITCAIIFVLLPFCFKEASVVGYSQYLSVNVGRGLSGELFRTNLLFALVLFAPICGTWFCRRPVMSPAECLLLAGLCISIALTVIIASLSASGPYHLLPFVPLCLYMVAVMAGAPSRESELAPQETIAIIFLLSLLAYGPGIYLMNSNLITYYNRTEQHEKIHELQTYLETYPNAQIGVSDDAHYSDTDYRILSVLAGHPLHIDFAAWGDLEYGVPERNIVRFIERCEVPTWILPLGTPFTKSSWYTERPMLSDDFRRTFSTNYQLIKMGQFYQVWGCRNSVKKKSNADLN